MADTDFNEWVLLDTDLTTRLAILPVLSSHLYLEFCEPGSGELRIPLDSTAAGLVTSGMFCQCFYRGASRGGFFVDNIKEVQADNSENSGRVLSVSGRGALALLEDAMIWDDGSGATTRLWTGATKASILIDMIDEAQGRGALANLTYDFSDTDDSASAAWTDSEDYKFNVGMSLLDLLREFAKTGTEFDINLTGGDFVLSAYQGGIGSNKSNTVFLRIGSNCLEVSDDYRGDDLVNVMRVKYKDGYITVSDATSITNYRRREKLLSLEQAQSGGTASTYAAAKLDGQKDPKRSISVRVYDGVPPYLFLDYIIGDTVTVDMMGTEVSYRVLGIQADFNSDGYSNVVLELNNILYENQLKVENDLDWILNQWNTAKDSNQLEVTYWQGLNLDDAVLNVVTDGTKIYFGGVFTKADTHGTMLGIGGYDTSTNTFFTVNTTGLPAYWGEYFDVRELCTVGTTLYCHVWDGDNDTDRIYKYASGSWTEIGNTADEVGEASGRIYGMASDGTNLWVCGDFAGVDGVGVYNCAYWDGASWNSAAMPTTTVAQSLVYFNGTMYCSRYNYSGTARYEVAEWNGSGWDATALTVNAVGGQSYYLLFPYSSTQCIVVYRHSGLYDQVGLWDGVSASFTDLLQVGEGLDLHTIYSAFAYLSDIYIFGNFFDTYSTGELFYNVARYSGGTWSSLEGGTGVLGASVYAGVVIGGDLYIGGDFTQAGGTSANYLAVRTTTFETAIRLASNSGFDLANAVHNAPASALSDNDEFGFWEDVSQAIRKITWANIKSTLKTYLDTLYIALTGNQSVAGDKTFTGTLKAVPSVADDTAVYAETVGDAYGIDLEQSTSDTNQTSPALFISRLTNGAGNITGAMIEGYQDATGAGTITGPFIRLDDNATSAFFEVDKDGNVATSGVFTPASFSDTDTPNNSIYYSATQSKLVYKDSGGTINNLY